MPADPIRFLTGRRWVAPALILALCVGASFPVVLNDLVQDDIPIILGNTAVHRLGNLGLHFRQPYWPKPFHTDAGTWTPAAWWLLHCHSHKPG